MIGDGEEKNILENKIKKLGLEDRTNYCHRNGIGDIYRQADLFIPSLWEGSSNALCETMAHGLPAVGFEVDGKKQLIENNAPAGFVQQ